MGEYLHILELRAVIEGIELDNLTTSDGEGATMQKYYEEYLKQTSLKEYDSTITCSNKVL
jgi:hypothetical protein